MTLEAQEATDEKFFFHMNNFDDELIEEEEVKEEAPPPPVFNEADLEAAKKAAFEEGRQQALQEAQDSRSQAVSTALGQISNAAAQLFANEATREKTYEGEAVALCLSVFQKLFPLFSQTHGFEEMKTQLEHILQSHEGKGQINIYVQPDYVEGIQAFMSKLAEKNDNFAFQVSGDEGLSDGAARLSWDDGGALRDTASITQQIEDALQEVLAGAPVTSHDKQDDQDKQPDPVPAPDNEVEPDE